MDLIIVRHARPGRAEDSADPGLADIGHQQAELVAERLATESIDHIVSSTMRRAYETAQPLADRLGLEVEKRDDLREADEHRGRYVPAEEMSKDDDIVKDFINNPENLFEHGYGAFRDGVVSAFNHVIDGNRGKTVAVFCHGLVMASYLQFLWKLDNPFMLQMDYTGLMRVTASSTGLRTVKSVNETGHVFDMLGSFGSEAPAE